MSFLISDDDHPIIEDVAQVLPPAAVQDDDDEDEIQEFVCTCKHNDGYPRSTRFKRGAADD